MKDAKNQNLKKNRKPGKKATYLFARLRPSYDLTDVLAELLTDEPDYTRLTAELAGVSMVAVERGDYTVDDNGNDLGDNVDDWNLD